MFECYFCGAATLQGPSRSQIPGYCYPPFCRRPDCIAKIDLPMTAKSLPQEILSALPTASSLPSEIERVDWAFENIMMRRLGLKGFDEMPAAMAGLRQMLGGGKT